jgi:uncharacterized protein DUF6680
MALEWWIVGATILGPVVAVQTQKFVERATENRRRQKMIFTALMANRATRLNDDYVRALNLIDIEFLPGRWQPENNRKVIEAWRTLFGELHNPPEPDEPIANRAWNQRCDDRLVGLLSAMSRALGHRYTDEELRRGIYYPRGKFEIEQVQVGVLHGARAVLEGKAALQMRITEIPVNPETAAAQAAVLGKLATAYTNEGELRVRISEPTVIKRR